MKPSLRRCFREPNDAVNEAVQKLDRAADAHLGGKSELAARLIAETNTPAVREWIESLWSKNNGEFVQKRSVDGAPAVVPVAKRFKPRNPPAALVAELHKRDGYRCRFCGLRVVRKEIRVELRRHYPDALPWGRTNASQHAAFQSLWAQYDHVVPWTRGGPTTLENMVVACAGCNFGRMERTVEEVGLLDPRQQQPKPGTWDGLERILR